MAPRLDPKLDVVFKMLFSREQNRELLVSLLTAVLRPTSPIAIVQVLNPELPREAVIDKGVVLDLHVQLADGRHVDVEMQSAREAAFADRALLYLARLYAGNLHAGQEYGQLQRCVSVLILGHSQVATPRFHCTFHMSEDRSHERFADALEIHTLELPKLPAWPPAPGLPQDPERALLDWGVFLAARSEAEVQEVAMQNPVISKAKTALDDLSAEPAARQLAEARLLGMRAWRAELAAQLQEGLVKGREEGREEGLRSGLAALAQALGLDWSEARRARVAALGAEDLLRLQQALVERRGWPEE
jgi:predicted transposase/invertase (TIGR01784 family)